MIRLVITNLPVDRAKEFAQNIVSGKYAGCVNLIPKIESIYAWEEKIVEDAETQLIIKTTESKLETLLQFIKAEHPYQVPEILVIQPSYANPQYMSWLRDYVEKS